MNLAIESLNTLNQYLSLIHENFSESFEIVYSSCAGPLCFAVFKWEIEGLPQGS